MINYYNLLDLDDQLSSDEIWDELSKLEKIWMQQKISQPNKSKEMLSHIDRAKSVFVSSNTKKEYDNALISKKDTEFEDVSFQRKQFNHWYNRAKEQYNLSTATGDDMVKTAIEKAIALYDEAWEDAEFFAFTSNVYIRKKQYNVALDYINQAIFIELDNWNFHYIKSEIYYQQRKFKPFLECVHALIELAENKKDSEGVLAGKELLMTYCFNQSHEYDKAIAIATEISAYENQFHQIDSAWFNRAYASAQDILNKSDFKKSGTKHSINSLDEISDYKNETSSYTTAIEQLIKIIKQKGMKPVDRENWLITQKKFHAEYEEEYGEEDISDYWDYELTPEGEFIVRYRHIFYYRLPGNTLCDINEEHSTSVSNTERVMLETDFDGYGRRDSKKLIETTTHISDMYSFYTNISISRYGYKKGQRLYEIIKKIASGEINREAEKKIAEEKRKAEQKAAEEKRKAEQKAAEGKRKAEQKAAEGKRKAEQKAAEEKHKAEQKAAEEKRKAEQKKQYEKKRAENRKVYDELLIELDDSRNKLSERYRKQDILEYLVPFATKTKPIVLWLSLMAPIVEFGIFGALLQSAIVGFCFALTITLSLLLYHNTNITNIEILSTRCDSIMSECETLKKKYHF